MMRKKFNSIEECLTEKKCVFCNNSLKIKLSNNSSIFCFGANNLSIFNTNFINNNIIFNFSYTTIVINTIINGSIDVTNNKITLNSSDENLLYRDLIAIFESFQPCLKFFCENKECNMRYLLVSNILYCERANYKTGYYSNFSDYTRIIPFSISIEICSIDKYLIQNDFGPDVTSIINSYNYSTIHLPYLISFNSMDKDKLVNRIKTIITFS